MTETESMVVRVAEAIWQGEWARAGNGGRRRVPWSEIAENDQARYRFIARAAIEAMKTPTPGMVEAGFSTADAAAKQYASPEDTWAAMIDKALEE